ncbi:MAG: hypothetical protein FD163_484 [Hyphomonadaceae bacterium]|nr:MAG: hypothetical protein FD128_667 [Hyphomonadaceae bacterium]KAF0187209.1 MAG: hypothetical protein FD163_484 [Hyphomonadaceae bacterium]
MSAITRIRRVVALFPNRVRGTENNITQTLAAIATNTQIVSVIGETIYVETPFDGNIDLGTFN